MLVNGDVFLYNFSAVSIVLIIIPEVRVLLLTVEIRLHPMECFERMAPLCSDWLICGVLVI
jgi:hypothetical protein